MSAISAWPAPNYIDPVRRDWMTPYAATWQIASGILVGARYWLRITNKAGGLGLDDALLLPGLIFSIMFTILAIVVAKFFGADRHMWDVPPDEVSSIETTAILLETSFKSDLAIAL